MLGHLRNSVIGRSDYAFSLVLASFFVPFVFSCGRTFACWVLVGSGLLGLTWSDSCVLASLFAQVCFFP